MFYRVQDRLVQPNKTKKQVYEFAYTGIIRCEHCGCLLTAELKKGKYIYYHCTGNKGGNCKRDYVNETSIDNSFAEILKLIVIPQNVKESISTRLKSVHENKRGYSKEVKVNIKQRIAQFETRIEKLLQDKLDGIITSEQWKKYNDKWQIEKDKLEIQLEEINRLEKQLNEQVDVLLGFVDDAYSYFQVGTFAQKRKIIEIISEKVSYKDKTLNIELKPIFQSIVENQYNFSLENSNNRTLENGIVINSI